MVMVRENNQAHVLLVAFSAQGHINPMLRFGKRLLAKGLDVTLATTEVTRTTFHLSPAASLAGINLVYYSDGLPLDHDRKGNIDFYMNTLMTFGPPNLTTLIKNQSKKFSCIINNPFVPWVADVAEALGIPCTMLWIQPCTLYSIYYQFCNKLHSFPTVNDPDLSVKLPGLPLLHTKDLPSFVLPSNTLLVFTNMLGEVFKSMNKLKWVLGNSFQELENDVIEAMNEAHRPIWPVGPLVPSALFGKDDELDGSGLDLFKSEDTCIEWLNKQQLSSVIYISFGSILYLSKQETESIALGLKKTKRPFLWVIKPEQNSSQEEPNKIMEEIKEQGLIVKWSPQTKVLAHSSVGCFFSHCGWNSLIETITAGVPVIAYPKWTDQPTNAKLITDVLRVGVRVETDEEDGGGGISGEEVERCIEEIMGGPRCKEYKTNAAELKLAAREAVADGGSSDRNIQLFVDEIISGSS